MQAVADLEQFFQLLADHQHGATGIAQIRGEILALRGGPHVHTPGGLRDDKQRRAGVDFAPDDEFLQVAARERTRSRRGAVGLDVEVLDQARGLRQQRRNPDPASGKAGEGNRLVAREQQVCLLYTSPSPRD